MNLPIEVAKSPNLRGIRCLIATQDINKGDIIETCPCVIIDKNEVELIVKTLLNTYTFEWSRSRLAAVLGYGMLYNHSYDENVRFDRNYKEKTMFFYASKDIKAGEELFINYNQGVNEPIDDDYLHFDRRK